MNLGAVSTGGLGAIQRRVDRRHKSFHAHAVRHARGDAGHPETGREAHRSAWAVHGGVGDQETKSGLDKSTLIKGIYSMLLGVTQHTSQRAKKKTCGNRVADIDAAPYLNIGPWTVSKLVMGLRRTDTMLRVTILEGRCPTDERQDRVKYTKKFKEEAVKLVL